MKQFWKNMLIKKQTKENPCHFHLILATVFNLLIYTKVNTK